MTVIHDSDPNDPRSRGSLIAILTNLTHLIVRDIYIYNVLEIARDNM